MNINITAASAIANKVKKQLDEESCWTPMMMRKCVARNLREIECDNKSNRVIVGAMVRHLYNLSN